jgi:hypothetical protein
MAHYLLPCECGRKLEITKADAGEQLTCACGRKVDVPTLRGFETLATAAAPAVPARRAWGVRQGLVFLGALLFGIAVVGVVLLQFMKPPTPEQILMRVKKHEGVDIDRFSPMQAWLQWNVVRQGLLRPYTPAEAEALKVGMNDHDNWRDWLLILCAAGGLGLVLLVGGLLARSKRVAVRRRPKPATATRH